MHLCDTYINTAVTSHLDPFLLVKARSEAVEYKPPKKREQLGKK